MPHEFWDCLRIGCFVHDQLIKKSYKALWAQYLKTERFNSFHVWQFYVEWRTGEGTHVTRSVCELHHREITALVERESAAEVREQEVTEQWLTRVNSQMLTDS